MESTQKTRDAFFAGRKQRMQIGFVMKDLGDEAGSAKGVKTLLAQYSLSKWEQLNLEAQIAAGGGAETGLCCAILN
jgi:hypothetical protein